MSTPIPPPLRAAAGLAALAIDSARKVPQQLVGLPVLAVSTALQASLKAQQAYAGLIARGDEVLAQLRGSQDARLARFDDEPAGGPPGSAFDAAPEPAEQPDGAVDRAADGVGDALAAEDLAAEDLAAEDLAAEDLAAEDLAEDLAAEDLAEDLTAEDLTEDLAAEDLAEDLAAEDLTAEDLTEDLAAEDLTEALAAEDLTDALAAEDLADALTAEAAEEAALVGEIDRDLDPDIEADVVPLAEARAEQAADAANVLGETEEDEVAPADAALAEAGLTVVELDLDPGGADRPNGRPEGSGTEPGADLPADGMALAADAAAAGAAMAADSPPAGPPLTGYDELSIPQLRGRLRVLTVEQIEALVAYERATRARPPYLTMLENRLTTLRSR